MQPGDRLAHTACRGKGKLVDRAWCHNGISGSRGKTPHILKLQTPWRWSASCQGPI